MKQTIRFKGLSLNKDEMSAEHGELSLCGNLELHDGALRPYQVDGAPLAGGDSLTGEIIYVHVTASYRHFITKQPDGLYWAEETEMKDSANHELYVGKVNNVDTDVYQYNGAWYRSADYTIDPNVEVAIDAGTTPVRKIGWKPETQIVANATLDVATIRSIKSVGNTLCILNSDGLYYILCKNSGGSWSYKYLGQQPPFLDLQFNLKFDSSNTYTGNRDTHIFRANVGSGGWDQTNTDEYGHFDIPEEIRSSLTESVMAEINKSISGVTDAGQFYAPFLIRYCYRMHDGKSMIMHSPPVLLFPMLQHPLLAAIPGLAIGSSDSAIEYAVFMLRATLQMKRLSERAVVRQLQEWSDIIKSVDIFVSPQFTRIDTAGTVKTYGSYESTRVVGEIGPYDFTAIKSFMDGEESITPTLINDTDVQSYFNGTYNDKSHRDWCLDFPEYDEKEYLSRIRNWSVFFKLTSTPVEQLITSGDTDTSDDKFCVDLKDVDVEPSVLKNIAVQEQMTDDYKTHNLLKPNSEKTGGLYVYNHRLNVYGIGETLFEGFSPEVMFPYALPGGDSEFQCSRVEVYVSTDSGLRKLKKQAPQGTPWTIPSWYVYYGYCFYPDDRAVNMTFIPNEGIVNWVRELISAAALNGALSFMPDSTRLSENWISAIEDAFVQMQDKIYTSKADNPFYFPNLPGESGINSVGTGEIIGIAAVTRPLVQGEVGKQNLVVFATDGIWVCEVSSTGTYSSMRNISREVCVNQESICQMDQSILFATNRSLSRFVESDVVSVSDVLDGPIFDIKNKMTAFDAYANAITLSWGAKLSSLTRFATPPLDFFREGKELYDYTGMRVIVFPKDIASGGVSLVYSIRDGAWSTIMFPALKTVINSYPSPYIQRSDGGVFCLDQAYDYKAQYATYGVIVTRTLSFSDTMDVLRGFRQYTDSAAMPLMFFYGSNDQRNWKYIGQTSREYYNYLPGHPYRFFRIGIFMNMYPSEEYQALELETVNKYAKL